MSLVKWLRKNNAKIMAVVVIVLMIGFVGGSYLQQLARRSSGRNETVAYFGKDTKITQNDIVTAQMELEILKIIRAEAILRSQDLRTLLLGELLFPERATSAELVSQIRQFLESSDVMVNEKQINDIYRGTMPAAVYWLMLTKEAEQAGFIIPEEEAGQTLAMIVPRLFDGASYQQLVTSLMRNPRTPISEDQIFRAFSKLLEVIQYVRVACSNENITRNQITNLVSRENETMDISFVRLDAGWFTKDVNEPSAQQINEQFEKYKSFFAGDISDDNPYGFGYKLPARGQLEYLAIKLDEVAKTIASPTNQEMEDYYQRNIEDFEMSYQADPNDPNSPVLTKTRSYGEVAGTISRVLSRQKTKSQAQAILQQAREAIEARLLTAETESEKLTSEQLKELSGDYGAIAKELSAKHGVKIYSGKTGLLSAADMQSDEILRNFYIVSGKTSPMSLTKVVFAIDEIGTSELGPFDPQKPKLYETIGPADNIAQRIMMLTRVAAAEQAAIAENIDKSFGIEGLRLNSDANEPQTYSVRENVVDDLKRLAAMDVAKNKAQEFLELAQKEGWDNAATKFNTLYPQEDTGEPNAFRFQELADVERLAKSAVEIMAFKNAGNPLAHEVVNQIKQQALLLGQLYSLVGADSEGIAEPTVVEFKPNTSYYCVENLNVDRINQSEYERLKASAVYREDFTHAQSMSAVYLNPENIVKRTNFRWAKQEMPLIAPEEPEPLPEAEF